MRAGAFEPPTLRVFAEDEPADAASAASAGPPLSPAMTLGEFFARYVLPCVLVPGGAAPRNIAQYRQSLDYWARYSGDPPLAACDQFAAARFAAALADLPGRRGGKLSANTRRKHAFHVQAVLDLAAAPPAAPARRDDRRLLAAGLIPCAPRIVRPPPVDRPPEDSFTLAEIEAILAACSAARAPAIEATGLPPAAWWQSLVLICYYTLLRIGTVLELRWEWLREGQLLVPAGALKGRRRPLRVELIAPGMEVLVRLPRRGPRMFAWPHGEGYLHAQRRRILAAAGIAPARRFGFHALRKAAATELARLDRRTAQIALGHTSLRTTLAHYEHPRVVAEALARVPRPRLPADDRQLRLFD